LTVVSVCSFLWRDPNAKHVNNYQFGAKHVNSLFRQLAKRSKALEVEGLTFRFYLYTDYPDISGFDLTTGLTVVPLWQDFRDLGRCFTRLKLFDPAVRDKYMDASNTDFTVMIDLDVVIVKPKEFLRTLVTKARLQPFLGYRDTKNPRCYSGAMWRIAEGHFGRFKEVYDTFRHIYDTTKVSGTTEAFFRAWNAESSFVGSDQCHITTSLGEHSYPTKINDKDHGVWDFWQIEDLPGGELPENAVAVFINGLRRDASMPEFQEKYLWIKENWVDV